MEKLFPIANKDTRHFFIEPLIHKPWYIKEPGYEPHTETSYIKPGKIPNLMELCRPEGHRFSITEEPNIDTLAIESIVFGMRNTAGVWGLYMAKGLNIKPAANGPSHSVLEGIIVLRGHQLIDPMFDEPVDIDPAAIVPIDINLYYARGSRCLEYSNEGNIDNGKPQILGLTFKLEHKDSKIV